MKLLRAVVTSFMVVGCGIGLQTAAGTSSANADGIDRAIVGNVVGRGSPADRTTLGQDATGCTATVEAGRGDDRFGAPVVYHYTIPGLNGLSYCPDLGTAVTRLGTDVADLVVTWFNGPPPGSSHNLYVLRHFTVLSSSDGTGFPGGVGSLDFNGDGRGDVVEETDVPGAAITTYLRRGRGFVQGPAILYNTSVTFVAAFGELDDAPGADIASFYFSSIPQPGLPDSAGTGVVVISGATGASVLLEHGRSDVLPPDVAIRDVDHDGNNDVVVSGGVSDDGGDDGVRVYLGDGHGHFHQQT